MNPCAVHPYAEVIGDPIGHSLSPTIHGFWLERLEIAGRYEATRVAPDALKVHMVARRADVHWRGMNVTLPHKVAVAGVVDVLTPLAMRVGAVNLVYRDQDRWIGDNSDVDGFLQPLLERRGRADPGLTAPLGGEHAAVFGAGGAARAVLIGLAQAGVESLTLYARDRDKARALLSALDLQGRVCPLDGPIAPATLVVNATPLGMAGQAPLDVDISPLPAGALVYDLIYAPAQTMLLNQAESLGLAHVNGLAMLVAQARIGFAAFFGQPAPQDEASRTALAALLATRLP